MRKLRVESRTYVDEFVLTRNVWLTYGKYYENNTDIIFKWDDKNSLLIVFGNIIDTSSFYSLSPKKKYEYILKHPSSLEGTAFLYDNSEKSADIYVKNNSFEWYFYDGEDLFSFDNIGFAKDIKRGNLIIIFDRKLKEKEFVLVRQFVQEEYNCISHCFLKKLENYMNELTVNLVPVALMDFVPKEAYKFNMKSTYSTVAMTIEMIKNKLLKYNYEKAWQVETVLHEALVNAITYGNELDPDKDVSVKYELSSHAFRILIADAGEGFDVDNILAPVGKKESLESISGRGIYIMHKFSDTMFYNKEGNKVLLFFDF